MQSEQIDKLAHALAQAQGEIRNAPKTSDNPFFKSRYADLAEVWDAVRGPMSKHGLAILQIPLSSDGKTVTIHTLLMHSSGQWVDGDLTLAPVKQDPQGIGSAATYARRYALQGFMGVAPTDDDDGNLASGKSIEDKAAKALQQVKAAKEEKPKENGGIVLDLSAWEVSLSHESDPEVLRVLYTEKFEGKNEGKDPGHKIRRLFKARIDVLEARMKDMTEGNYAT
jgi:hypothetical protein